MANFNKVILLGNLTRDPQLRYLPNQTPVADFGLAVNRRWRGPNGEDREEVTFVDCTAWARQAEVINQYVRKGSPIFIEGRLKYDSWEDKQGGGKRSRLSVVVENFQLLGGRGDAPADAPPEGAVDPRPQRQAQQRGRPTSSASPQQDVPPVSDQPQFKEDDIPF